MAANSLAKSAGYGLNDEVSAAEFQTVQTQAGQSVNRTNTVSGWRCMPLIVCSNGDFATDDNGQIYLTNVSTPSRFNMPLAGLPNGHTLTAIRLWILPASATRSATPPANLPIFRLFKRTSNYTANPTLLGTVTATWGSEAAYESGQVLLISSLTETINLDSASYFAQLVGEHGSDAYAGLAICGLDCQVTVDTSYGGQDITMWRKA